jgi:hypothetical protein
VSAAGTRSREDVGDELGVAHAVDTPEAGQFSPGAGGRSYAEEQARTRRRNRIATFALCIVLWALAAVPLARELSDGGAAEILLSYLGVAAGSLGVATAISAISTLVMRRRLVTPGLFVVAGVLAIAGFVVHTAGEPPRDPLAASATLESRQAG